MFHRRDLSLSEKNEILNKFDALPKCSQRQAAIKLGIPQSSLSRILQQREKILRDISSNCNTERKRKRSGKDVLFGDFLLNFYEEYVRKHGSVSRSIIVNKAEELAREFGLKDFKATDGWLSRWKLRNNLTAKKDKIAEYINSGQNSSVIESISSILENYTPDKIFNADIAEFNIYSLPNCNIKSKNSTSSNNVEEDVATPNNYSSPDCTAESRSNVSAVKVEENVTHDVLTSPSSTAESNSSVSVCKIEENVTVLDIYISPKCSKELDSSLSIVKEEITAPDVFPSPIYTTESKSDASVGKVEKKGTASDICVVPNCSAESGSDVSVVKVEEKVTAPIVFASTDCTVDSKTGASVTKIKEKVTEPDISASKSDTSHNKIEEKVSVLFTCSMVGNKKVPLVVGRKKHQDCFKGIKSLPIQYCSSEDALITREIFIAFLLNWDKELGHEKIVLILDCSFSHFKDLPLQNIKMVFFPSPILPLDQGIIKMFKLLYKKSIQNKVCAISDGKDSAERFLNELPVLDAMHSIANAWLNVPGACVYNAFKKAGFYRSSSQLENIVDRLKQTESTKAICVNPVAWPDAAENGPEEAHMLDDDVGETHIVVPDIIIPEDTDMVSPSEEMNTDAVSKETAVTASSQEMEIDLDSSKNDAIISEGVGMSFSQKRHMNVFSKSTDDEANISNSDTVLKKLLEMGQNSSNDNASQDNFTSNDTHHALSVIRKTLEQKGASVACYELFYRMENEIYKLLQKQ